MASRGNGFGLWSVVILVGIGMFIAFIAAAYHPEEATAGKAMVEEMKADAKTKLKQKSAELLTEENKAAAKVKAKEIVKDGIDGAKKLYKDAAKAIEEAKQVNADSDSDSDMDTNTKE